MLNRKNLGLMVLALALSSPMGDAIAGASKDGGPGGVERPTLGMTYYCYGPSKCKTGYTLSTDGATCLKDIPTYSGLEECELANIMNKCEPDGTGKYIPTTCLDGAYADGTCKGVDDDSGDCETDFVSSPCEYDGKGYYVPVNCPRTKAACEAKYIYDNCVKTPEANCWIPNGGKYPAPEASASCTGKNTGAYGMGYAICAETTEKACQTVYPGFNCQLVNDPALGNIYAPMGCKTNYTFNNGKCESTCATGTYGDEATCRDANPGWDCTQNAKGCYAPSGCSIGYEDNTFHIGGVGEDRLGSGVCDCIFYQGKAECESTLGATCNVDKYGCPIPDVNTCP